MSPDSRRIAPTCRDCIHFFVTYDPSFPYGCRSVGIKSRRYPYLEVQAATGEPCQGWETKRSLKRSLEKE